MPNTYSYPPYIQGVIFDGDGRPAAGGTVEAYVAGSSAPAPLFSISDPPTSLGSVVAIDSAGVAAFRLREDIAYKLRAKDRNGALLWERDNVRASGQGGGGGMENPMTEQGDLIVGATDGKPDRLGVGADGDILSAALFGGSFFPTWEAGPKKYRNVYQNIPWPQIDDGYLGCLFYLSGGGAQTINLPSAASIPNKSFIDFVFLDDATTLTITPQGTTILNTQGSPITIGGKSASLYRLTFLGRSDIGGVQIDQWALGGSVSSGGGGGMTNPMTGFGQMIFGGPGGAPSVLSSALSAGKYLKSINVGPGRYQPVWADLPSTCQENFSLLNVTNFYDAGQQTNKLFCSKVVANATAKRSKLAFFHKSGDVGKVILGVYDNAGNLLAQTAPFSPDSSTFEQMCWNDTLASFTLTAGEEYWFAAYFTPDNWSCTVNALGLEKSSAFDVNLVGSRSVGVLTELPATLGTLSYETLAWYMSAM